MILHRLILAVLLLQLLGTARGREDDDADPTWDQIDARPLPDWYDDVKFGIMSHWGVYSVPALGEWFWVDWVWGLNSAGYDSVDYMKKYKAKNFVYQQFADDFTADLYNASEFVAVMEAAGARYFVLTTKHHEGFTLWPSTESWQWNAVDAGPRRDLIAETKAAFAAYPSVRFGLYFSHFEWFHPYYISDSGTNQTNYPDTVSIPQFHDIINRYEPDVLWSDGEWERSDEYWRSRKLLNWLYTESPVKERIVVNDRWGIGTPGRHGGFLTPQDRFNPKNLLSRKWENAMTIDRRTFGIRDNITAADVLSVQELLEQLIWTISCGGNMLLNVPLNNRGRLQTILEERLRQMGVFIKANSEAIYGTKPWAYQNETARNVWYTARRTDNATFLPTDNPLYITQSHDPQSVVVYAFVADFGLVDDDTLLLKSPKPTANTSVEVFVKNGTTVQLDFTTSSDGILVSFEKVRWRQLPTTDAVVLRLSNLAADNQVPVIRNATDFTNSLQSWRRQMPTVRKDGGFTPSLY